MNYQERARRITREAGVPNHASLYSRIIEHVADAIASVERETAQRCAEIAADAELENTHIGRAVLGRAVTLIREEFGIS